MQPQAIMDTGTPPASIQFQLPGAERQAVDLKPLPFVIGRAESVDLQIPANRVSREHAVVSWEGGEFWIRDLGSTNGTFVNGARVERHRLGHGDTLCIADIDLQLLLDEAAFLSQQELVAKLRGWQELASRRGVGVGYKPIWNVAENRAAGYLAVHLEAGLSAASRWPEPSLPGTRLSSRLHWLTLARAAELAQQLPKDLMLLMELDSGQDAAVWLPTLAQLADGRELALILPGDDDSPSLAHRIAEFGLKVVRTASSGKRPAQPADYWWLAPEFTRQVGEDENLWQPLSDIVDAAKLRGAEPIVTGIDDEDSAHVCAELDCHLALGQLFGEPQPAGEHQPETP